MRSEKRRNGTSAQKLRFCVLFFFLAGYLVQADCPAVTSNVTRHSSSEDFLKGQTKNVVVGSEGTIQLGLAAEVLIENFEVVSGAAKAGESGSQVWSINSIVVSGGDIYIGTSPNGGIYKYGLGKLTKIYPSESKADESSQSGGSEPNALTRGEGETVGIRQYLSNEHIFAMALDMSGRLLAGVSGDKCALYRFEADKKGKPVVIFEPDDAKYIFAIAIDATGNIYLGTGPEGKIYVLDSSGRNARLVYDSRDKNILSLAAGKDDFIYAGSDSRGIVYKINPGDRTTAVLYDSEQPEITALLFSSDGNLYATATSAEIAESQPEFTTAPPSAGRPEVDVDMQEGLPEDEGGLKLEIANTERAGRIDLLQGKSPVAAPSKPAETSYVYRITKDGFVTEIFTETAVLYCLAEQQRKLLVGTGNDGRAFTIDPATERRAVCYQDEQATQVSAVAVSDDGVYLGTANPAKLIKLARTFAREGTYTSALIDAGQPADWGKLQIEADIPQGCKVKASCRSGNVNDVNDPTFSSWSEPLEITEPMQLQCPIGRFCQYKLVLQTEDARKSPLIREIAVADTVPNLAPKLESVSAERVEGKTGIFKISFKAKDDNEDVLIYKIDFRKIGREKWIELEKDLETDSFEWDGRTAEDGRYEIRVTASDERSNTTATKLTGSRITEPVVVDNTGPVIKKYSIESGRKSAVLKLQVSDQLSAIGEVDYTIDSNAGWISAVPDDFVYDTTDEDFTIGIEQLDAGEHIIAVKASDDVGNTTYKTFEVTLTGN
jgi:hypothetical protein